MAYFFFVSHYWLLDIRGRKREREGDLRKRSPYFKNCVTCLIWGRKLIRITQNTLSKDCCISKILRCSFHSTFGFCRKALGNKTDKDQFQDCIIGCCVFRPINRCSARRLLWEIDFSDAKTTFSITNAAKYTL